MLPTGSVFSGIGGFELGLCRAAPYAPVWFCESNDFCRSILARHHSAVPQFLDVRGLHAKPDLQVGFPRPLVLTGGFPCQDISVSGSGMGLSGERSGLWVEMAKLISKLRPRRVLIENSPALVSRGLDLLLADLHTAGYKAEWQVLNSQMVGGLHQRRRIYISASLTDAFSFNFAKPADAVQRAIARVRRVSDTPEPARRLLEPGEMSPAERKRRIHALGNAVDPRVAQLVGEMLLDCESPRVPYSRGKPGIFPCGYMVDGEAFAAPRLAPTLLAGALPTLRASDWRSGKVSEKTMQKNSRPLCEVLGGHINPTWAEWFMGFPVGWTAQ